MNKFRKSIITKTICIAIIMIAAAVAELIFMLNQDKLPNVHDFIKGFQAGTFTGLELILLFIIGGYLKAIRNEEALKKLYISETDERKLMIGQKAASMSIAISGIGMAFASVIAGFFSQTVFLTLLITTFCIMIITVFLKLYYSKKY